MSDTIRLGKDGKLWCCCESTEGFPARQMLNDRLGEGRVHHIPAEGILDLPIDGDAILVLRRKSQGADAASRLLKTRLPALPPSGYRIECTSHRSGKALVVAGGDLFGMLAGLADLLRNSELTRGGLSYRGGTKTEKPAFPLRYYWTWDHSTNWVLDDPGNQVGGCSNQYLKKPETFIEDYRRLVDHCLESRFNAIVIWGFLRDSHGGESSAYQVAKYAADRGVAILPGLGTTGYGGIYYEGQHPYNIETYLTSHPERGNMWEDGQQSRRETSPYHPANLEWLRGGVEWLYSSFPIGGANLENNDLMVDCSPAGKRGRKNIRSGEADFLKDQFFAYKSALDVADRLAPGAWNTYATYCGFARGRNVASTQNYNAADVGVEPYFAKRMPKSAIAQWTLTQMVLTTPVPLRDWMKSPRPEAVYRNPNWPKGLRPPTPRSAGLLHQASAFSRCRRWETMIGTVAEACLRSHESGLEGMTFYGEAGSRTMPWLLNYLAMRHWTYHPESTLEEFAHSSLAPWVGGPKEAGQFVEALCLIEGKDYEKARKLAGQFAGHYYPFIACDTRLKGNNPAASRTWEALMETAILKERTQAGANGGMVDLA